MRILFAGTPAVAVPSLNALVDAGHDVVGVLTQADAPGKRGKKLVASPVAQRAAELGLETFKPTRARDPEFVAQVADLAPECCAVVAYGQLISKPLLAIPRYGWLNLHFSLLPRWRGAAPVQRSIMAGDRTTGASVFELVPELDAGPVYATMTDELCADDTTDAVLERLALSGAGLLAAVIATLPDRGAPTPQPSEGITLAPKLSVEECRLDWTRPADELDRLIRGAHSNPGAWTTLRGERFKVALASPRAADGPADEDLGPGELHATKRALWVGTGTQPLELVRVQAFGKKEMTGADWARGVSLEAGEGFDR